MTMVPIWFPIKGFPLYRVSDRGLIKNHKTGRIIKHCALNKPDGYRRVSLHTGNASERKSVLVHRIVAIARLPNPENKRCVNHKDGNKPNFDVDNLEWVTDSENAKHAYYNGLLSKAGLEANWNAKRERSTCKNGHEFDGLTGTRRTCKTCAKQRNRRYRARLKLGVG